MLTTRKKRGTLLLLRQSRSVSVARGVQNGVAAD